jgi:hypothetical protein
MMKVIATPSIPDRQDQTCVAPRGERKREQAFKHSVETWSVPSLDRPKTLLNEARHAIPQQGRKRKHQPRCHIKTFDPRTRARDQDRKQVASPCFGRFQQVNGNG